MSAPSATLVVNANAGGAGARIDDLAEERLRPALEEAGYRVELWVTESETELEKALAAACDVVVAAGGDGTFREIVGRLRGRDQPVALVPMGTANNAAHAFGLDDDPVALLRGLARPRRRALDVGLARGPWGEAVFLEGAGLGLFAEVLCDYDPDAGKSVWRALGAVGGALGERKSRQVELELDDRDVTGTYLMVECLNTAAVGPRLKFAPGADPFDGRFDLLRVREDDRDSLLGFLNALVREEFPALDSVEMLRGRRLRIAWRRGALHVDGQVLRHADFAAEGEVIDVRFELEPGAVPLWLPTPVEDA